VTNNKHNQTPQNAPASTSPKSKLSLPAAPATPRTGAGPRLVGPALR
jgi:hypothetical protein